jgi:hypothetical protein
MSLENVRVSSQEWISFILYNGGGIVAVALLNLKVNSFDGDAVRWNLVACMEDDDVTDN